jgi:hypothetical protein
MSSGPSEEGALLEKISEMTAPLYRLWALSVSLAITLQFIASWALTLLVPY